MKFDGTSIGVVLSGGGTRGIAHAGVLKFFEETGIFPDHLAGTSSGAIVSSLYAGGHSPEEILGFFKSIYFFHWRHLTLRKPGFIDSGSFREYFENIFKDATLGEMPYRMHITATDLVSGKLHIFPRDTRVVDAILASSAFPGVISPYKINGKIYSDGGILNTFPTDILQGRCETIIGSYVNTLEKVTEDDLRSIKSVVTRAYELIAASSNMQKFILCDWVINPEELALYGTFETNKQKMDEIFDIGYNAAKKSYESLIV